MNKENFKEINLPKTVEWWTEELFRLFMDDIKGGGFSHLSKPLQINRCMRVAREIVSGKRLELKETEKVEADLKIEFAPGKPFSANIEKIDEQIKKEFGEGDAS